MKNISSVTSGSRIREFGPVIINGDVGEGAHIEIKEGSLEITGNVDKNATIKCTAEKISSSSHTTTNGTHCTTVVIGGGRPENSGSVTIGGSVAENVVIEYAGQFDCTGGIDKTARIKKAAPDAVQISSIVNTANPQLTTSHNTSQVASSKHISTIIKGNVKIGRIITAETITNTNSNDSRSSNNNASSSTSHTIITTIIHPGASVGSITQGNHITINKDGSMDVDGKKLRK